jgi:hypothetical protein
MSRIAIACAALVAAACGPPPARAPAGDDPPGAAAERWYRLSWRHAAVGWAVDRERPGRIERRERIEVRRGDAVVVTDFEAAIEVAADLAPLAIVARGAEGDRRWTATAIRRADGWHAGGAAAAFAPPDAVPSELVPLHVRAHGQFAGPVILEGWQLAVGHAVVIPAGTNRLAARTTVGDRAIDTAIELDTEGNATALVDSAGMVAMRADEAGATAPWQPPDMIDAGAIALADTTVPIEVALDPGATPAPPPLPGQRVVAAGGRWLVTLDPALPGTLASPWAREPSAERREAPGPPRGEASVAIDIADLAAAVHETITPSLAGNTATAGDCTAYAVAFAAYARIADIPMHVVTGYLVDGPRLVRHRWNVAWTGARWITVDASQPAAPAPRLGVALGDETATSLAAAAMFDVR